MAGPRHTLVALALGLSLAGCSQAESAPSVGDRSTKAAPAVLASVPSGSTLIFEMTDEISTKSAHAGDAFSARLLSDFADHGTVLLPAGSTLHGTIAESMESPRNEEPAVIRLVIGSLETPSGTLLMSADVEELQMTTDAKDTNTLSAGKVAAGAAAGAIIGKIAGKTKTGAAAGTAAGVALAIATRDGHATIPQGARLVIRLTERLSLK